MSVTPTPSIADAFSSAAPSYDDAAVVQREVARRLAERIITMAPPNPRVLEVGCGTGFLSRLLLDTIPGGQWLLTDLAPAMVERARSQCGHDPRVRFAVMDGEHPNQQGPFDLIVSSLAVQWFGDMGAGLQRLYALLAPGGRLMLTTLGDGTFPEWRQAHADLGLPCGARQFLNAHQFPQPSDLGGLSEDQVVIRHVDGHDFARSLRAIGAHVPEPGYTPLTPGQFRRVLKAVGEPCPATYHILYGCWRAPG